MTLSGEIKGAWHSSLQLAVVILHVRPRPRSAPAENLQVAESCSKNQLSQ